MSTITKPHVLTVPQSGICKTVYWNSGTPGEDRAFDLVRKGHLFLWEHIFRFQLHCSPYITPSELRTPL